MKLIAIDLDGTLLNSSHQVSDENERALREARQAGIEIVVSTGRAHFDVHSIFEPLGIKTWVISANGAAIHAPDGRLYHCDAIEETRARGILSWLEENQYYYEVFTNKAIYTPVNSASPVLLTFDHTVSSLRKKSAWIFTIFSAFRLMSGS